VSRGLSGRAADGSVVKGGGEKISPGGAAGVFGGIVVDCGVISATSMTSGDAEASKLMSIASTVVLVRRSRGFGC